MTQKEIDKAKYDRLVAGGMSPGAALYKIEHDKSTEPPRIPGTPTQKLPKITANKNSSKYRKMFGYSQPESAVPSQKSGKSFIGGVYSGIKTVLGDMARANQRYNPYNAPPSRRTGRKKKGKRNKRRSRAYDSFDFGF